MKRIVIACDGTWSRYDSRHPTNVARLSQAVLPRAADGVEQLTFHVDGVGTGRGAGRIAQALDRALGGVFGTGLGATLCEAYRTLVLNYAPGDDVFLFGFSRGAFLARSLAGLVRTAGIVERSRGDAVPAALALYRRRGPGARPKDPVAAAFRVETGGAEPPDIRYLGVWDTVGALGVPAHLRVAPLLNADLQFHDASLSRRVRAARHAVALDERRRTFAPALWDNVEALNAGRPDRPYQQLWFPGDHSSVGGGGPVRALSSEAALWVMEGAMEAGLAFDPESLADLSATRDWRGPLRADGTGPLAALLRRDGADREGPSLLKDVSEAAALRWRNDPDYRPRALAHLASDLDADARTPFPARRRPGKRAKRRAPAAGT